MKILQFCMISACILALSGCFHEKEKAPAKPIEAIKVAPLPDISPAKK